MAQEYQHLRNIKRKSKNPDAFIDPYIASITFCQGNRGSGKSTVDELIAEEHFKMGHTVIDLHSAGNYESLYWCIKHDCRKFWDKWRAEQEKLPDNMIKQEEPLHCECDTRYKIILVVPDYIEFDEIALDEFNGRFYTKKEWADLGHIDYGKLVTKSTGETVREPPIRPDYVEWIRVRKLTIPNKGYKNRDQFVKELTEIMLMGQNEKRILVFNPIFYKDIPHKLVTLEKVLREIPAIVQTNFKAMTPRTVAELRGVEEPIPFGKWTPQEENRHRVTILMREFGSLVSSQLTEERNQVIVKKAIFALVKVLRHFHISLVGDFQRANDIYSGVREQRDYFVWKCSNIDIVSEDYQWLRNDIKERRDEIIAKGLPAQAYALFPNLEDLKPNQMYVLYPQKNERGNRYKLFTVKMPSFHHHQADDDFEVETGMIKETVNRKGTWRMITKTKDGVMVESEKDRVNEDKKVREANMTKVYDVSNALMHPSDPTKKKMKALEVFDHLGDLGIRPDGWTMSAFRKWLQRERKKRGL